jgi:hypothetical protein
MLALLVMLIFVFQNLQRSEVSFLGLSGDAPLGLALLGAALLGGLVVFCLGSVRILQLRKAHPWPSAARGAVMTTIRQRRLPSRGASTGMTPDDREAVARRDGAGACGGPVRMAWLEPVFGANAPGWTGLGGRVPAASGPSCPP